MTLRDLASDYLKASLQLTRQEEYLYAVACFSMFGLIYQMEYGEEIVFADEIGSWMIRGDEEEYVAAYITSLAATTGPEEFTEGAIPLIRRDSWQSFTTQAYAHAIRVADEAQQKYLNAEIQRQNIRTERRELRL